MKVPLHAVRGGEPGADTGGAAADVLFTPGARREEYFEELAEIGRDGTELSPEQWEAFYLRHGQYMVGDA